MKQVLVAGVSTFGYVGSSFFFFFLFTFFWTPRWSSFDSSKVSSKSLRGNLAVAEDLGILVEDDGGAFLEEESLLDDDLLVLEDGIFPEEARRS